MPADYGALTSKLRVKPTFTLAEEVIRKDFAVKLPSRRYIHLWNTPEISQCRGYQDSLDEAEERKHIAQVEHIGIRQAAREANSPEMPNMEIIGEMLSQQRQSATAMAQHVRDMAEQTRREAAGMAAEHSAELQRLANGQAEAANRQRMAESVLTGLRDTALEQRNHIEDLASKAGQVTNNIDQRHFETHNHNQTTTNTQMTDVNVLNQVMNMM